MTRLLEILQEHTGLGERSLQRIAASAPERYKVYTIAKRSGGRREIAHPATELKVLQRVLVDQVLNKLPVHPAAMAYVQGRSIRSNATAHAVNGPILKYDFENFFPSITERDWRLFCRKHNLFEEAEDLRISTRLLFRRPKGGQLLRLSIGAPSSPHLSNVLMYEFDRLISERVSQDFVTYTRYADDLAFSAKRTGFLNSVPKALAATLRDIPYPRLKINEEKTVLATTKYHRQITGLVLTLDGRVSIGRERKRKLRAAIHHFAKQKLASSEIIQLWGLLAFARDIEPDFYLRMQLHYGQETIDLLNKVGGEMAQKQMRPRGQRMFLASATGAEDV
jgi:retron-type reverse transcriptase